MLQLIRKRLNDDRFSLYWEEINRHNYQKMQSFILVGLIWSAAVTIIELLMQYSWSYVFPLAMVFPYFLLLLLVHRAIPLHSQHITLYFYLIQLPLMAFGILMGTFLDPGRASITIMVFLCVLPLFILDKPSRICHYISGVILCYAFCCYVAKDYSQFRVDMIDLAAFGPLAIGINLNTLFDRMESIEVLVKCREEAVRDTLTGVYNRRGGDRKISQMIKDGIPGAFLIIDIDNFKEINDTYGHSAGDEALFKLAKVISLHFRSTDVIMRLGGDEFTVYAVGTLSLDFCVKKLENMMEDIRGIGISGIQGTLLTVSIGCVLNSGGATDYESIFNQADSCLYRAKSTGKDHYVLQN